MLINYYTDLLPVQLDVFSFTACSIYSSLRMHDRLDAIESVVY